MNSFVVYRYLMALDHFGGQPETRKAFSVALRGTSMYPSISIIHPAT
ncbi:hypothetical protein SAMN05660479_01826 [Microbulbifer thermotolerans]|nr:hypothetical protein SAMN05660479_01826 [Microbulbifer thermotolerans]